MRPIRLFRPEETPAPADVLTVRDVLALYQRHAHAQNLHTAQGRATRRVQFDMFCGVCGDLAAAEIKPYHLSDWIEAQPGWKSTSTRRASWNFVRAAFGWAFDQERIARNPFRKNPYAEAERRPDMPEDAIAQLAERANKPFELAVRFLRLTGCRTGELCNAVWADFDLDRGVWTIPKHKTRKTTRKAKVVALVPGAVELLHSVTRALAIGSLGAALAEPGSAPGRHVFVNTRGRPWKPNTLAHCLSHMKKKGLIETAATLHGIRHRVGSACIAGGAPLKLVAAQLGHASARTTEAYYCDLYGELEAIKAAVGKGLPK